MQQTVAFDTQCSFSPFVMFMSSISMSVDRERMTGTSTVQKAVDDKLDNTATVQNSLTIGDDQ